MSKHILVRNIPDHVSRWIEEERQRNRMSQQEFILSVLNSSQTATGDTGSRIPNPSTSVAIPFKFADFFAGIGGFRVGLERLGGECVFSSEWDKYSQKTYKAWHGDMPHGDIRELNIAEIPDHDILAAGFPCQPFSLAGVSKKKSLGREHGFKDNVQGNMFFYLATIIEAKRPPIVLLENVKNLKSHDGGKTWKVIKDTLEGMNYAFFDRIYDAVHWVPQHRERVIIACFDKKVFGENPPFIFPEPPEKNVVLESILEKRPDSKYTLTDTLWNYLQQYAEKHQKLGNGFGFGIGDPKGITRTLSARYHKDGSEILIRQKNKNPRRLTPRECARLMGFPDKYPIVVSDTQAYRQFGNAVVVPVVEAVGKSIQEMIFLQLLNTNGCLLKETNKNNGISSRGKSYNRSIAVR